MQCKQNIHSVYLFSLYVEPLQVLGRNNKCQ